MYGWFGKGVAAAAVLAALSAGSAAAAPDASVPRYSIGQAFTRGQRSPQLRFARIFDEHAVVTSTSYRVTPERVRFFYHHPSYGPQIRELLKGDPLLRFDELDRFLTANLYNFSRASFYREGFVTLQLVKPESVVIIPVSLVTVKRSEALIDRYMRLEPALFR
jgi:hypothetical protein